eukprot:scaffold261724_cov19-Tisochrysis_lutea.AAC.1
MFGLAFVWCHALQLTHVTSACQRWGVDGARKHVNACQRVLEAGRPLILALGFWELKVNAPQDGCALSQRDKHAEQQK